MGKKSCVAVLALLTAAVFAACGGGGGGGSSTPASTLPVVTTGSATSTWHDNATLNGSVNPNGFATNAWFVYGTTSTLTDNTCTDNVAVGSGTSAVTLSPVNIGNLAGDTRYYYAVVAESSQGKVAGEIRYFETPAQLPTVITGDGAPTAYNAAVVNGTVNPNGYSTGSWVEYGTSPSLAGATATPNVNRGSGTANIPIELTLSGLTASTNYYYRFAAESSSGISRGEIRSFTTPALGGPLADAGSDQTVFMRGVDGATLVTLDGSGSVDSDAGTITTWAWTQVSGTPVTLNTPAAPTTTFAAPQIPYGVDRELVFQLQVTDDSSLTSTANVTVTLKWGFLDDFSTDTTGEYTPTGLPGALAYGAQVATLTTGADNYASMSRLFGWTGGTEPPSRGKFSIDFTPLAYYGTGGIEVKLGVTDNTYYKISTVTGIAQKIYIDNVVSSATFTPACALGTTNTISITFDLNDTSVNVCGVNVVLPHESVDHAISEAYFTVTAVNMDAEVDNFKLEKHPSQ